MTEKTKPVKVKAFPIAAKMTLGAPVASTPAPGAGSSAAVDAKILKLTQAGFLLEMPIAGLKTGAKFTIDFEIPVTHHKVSEACVIVKLYTAIGSHVIEGHFQGLSLENEQRLMRFLNSIPRAETK